MKFSEMAYERVGLGTVLREGGVHNVTRPALTPKVEDDPSNMEIQRELAGVTEFRRGHIPVTTGALPMGRDQRLGMLDSTPMGDLKGMGVVSRMPRIFENREFSNSYAMLESPVRARLSELRERIAELRGEVEAVESAWRRLGEGSMEAVESLRECGVEVPRRVRQGLEESSRVSRGSYLRKTSRI